MIATLERAHALRALADRLPETGAGTAEDADMLRQLADEQQQRAEYDAWVRAKVARARADARPSLTTKQVEEHMEALLDRMRAGADDDEYGFGSALHAVAKRNGVTDDDVDALLAAICAAHGACVATRNWTCLQKTYLIT